MKILEIITEGGHVFAGKTASIKREDINSTITAYFTELKKIFPKKAAIFTTKNFVPLGSVGKKEISGDIDFGIDAATLLDKTMSDASIKEWGVDPKAVQKEFAALEKRARSSSPEQLRMKAFLKSLCRYLNEKSNNIESIEKKVTPGNMFTLFPQISESGKPNGAAVQIDWMVGNLSWLKFSYYSAAYPPNSNVKGLMRTQLLLSAFQTAGLSFDHVAGVKDKETGKTVAIDPKTALTILGKRLGFAITANDAEDFYKLNDLFKTKMSPEAYRETLDRYYKILDSTRADIPDVLQKDWISRKDELGLTGKFLPDNSALKGHAIMESGVTGADRIKSRADFAKFIKSYQQVISKFPGFVDLRPSGSYNSNPNKNNFGDIDLIIHIKSDKDKATIKKELQQFFTAMPETVIVPFTSPKHAGKRTYNAGELVSARYYDKSLGYSVQIDNIISLSALESEFKQQFLDYPAEVQGLLLGLVKIAAIETEPNVLFKKLGIRLSDKLESNQEYEFNLSGQGLQLRKITYEPGTYKEINREILWRSTNFDDVRKLLYQYSINASFEDLLRQAKAKAKNPRSGNRLQGIFNSMITVKSGEVNTPKGAGKINAQNKIKKTFQN